jgi:glycosyltransferase involved in cell wall biosynthesis
LITSVWPEPQSSAAGLRDQNIVQGLRALEIEVVIASAARNEGGRARCAEWVARDSGLSIRQLELNCSSTQKWLQEIQPEGVIFDRFIVEEQFGARVREAVPEALTVLDTQDLHFLRLSREQAHRQELRQIQTAGQGLDSLWDADLVCRELSAIHRVDLVWLVSDFERELLVNEFEVDAERLVVSRFAYPEPPLGLEFGDSAFEGRSGFVLLGNFRHAPNLDAFRWMRAELWPEIRRRLPQAQIQCFGAYPPKEVMQAHAPQKGFHVHGSAADLSVVFSSPRVSLAPLRFGAGIKGKISDSWWYGVPVVSTSLGAEGMGDASEWGGLVTAGAASFVEACCLLHEDASVWKQAHQRGRKILRERFSWDVFLNGMQESLDRARARRATKSRDWVRQMLCHASADQYRYFGRWLESKQSVQSSRVGR